ncbi:hypothetical protein LTR86_005909 [Recurvomyces mirabilis]|nr:hypothetical protein LTR86_005909 [Recurvomyces mirabilis]
MQGATKWGERSEDEPPDRSLREGQRGDRPPLRACAEALTHIQIKTLKNMRNSEIHEITSTAEYLGQMVAGKVSIEDAFTKIYRAERMVKELGVPVPDESPQQVQASELAGSVWYDEGLGTTPPLSSRSFDYYYHAHPECLHMQFELRASADHSMLFTYHGPGLKLAELGSSQTLPAYW